MSNFTKIRAVGAELFHTDGQKGGQADTHTGRQTDIAKLIFAFRNFANAPKNLFKITIHSPVYRVSISNVCLQCEVTV